MSEFKNAKDYNNAREAGLELSEEQLSAVKGGWGDSAPEHCPLCGSTKIKFDVEKADFSFDWKYHCKCLACGHKWEQ